MCEKGNLRSWVTNYCLQAWLSCSASFSAEVGRFVPWLSLLWVLGHWPNSRCHAACA